jgi:hypothetical protein
MKYEFLVDGDELLYTAAFAVETTAYKLKIKDRVYDFGTKYDRKQIMQHCLLQGKVNKVDYEIITYKVPRGPVEFALKCCKNLLSSLEDISLDIKLFLTSDDKTNFRYSVAKTPGPNGEGYKAGRPQRPIYYQQCREYLLRRGAIEVSGMEADDALGIYQSDKTVAVHQDKDINRIVGRHYNWKTKERYIVKDQLGKLWLNDKKSIKGVGNAWFFAQMLLGDRVDNIPTIIGHSADVTCLNMLSGCKTEQDYFSIIQECYYNHYGDDYEIKLDEMGDLLYIMDYERIRGSEYLRKLL